MDPSSLALDEAGVLECLQRPLDHLTYGSDHGGDFVLRVVEAPIGGLFDKRMGSACVVDEQSRHTRDHRTEREVFDHLFVRAQARCKESDDVDADVGMTSQETEYVGLWNDGDRTLCDRNRIRRIWLIVEHRNVRERASRPEHLENLLTTAPPT